MWSINLIRRLLITLLALSAIGVSALWWHSASSTYVSDYQDCFGTTAILPGWRAQFAVASQTKLTVYGQDGRVDLHWIWKDYSVEGIDKAKVHKQYRFGGFRYRAFAIGRNRALSGSAPFWFLVSLLAAYPVASFIRGPVVRWRRHRIGACLQCGYSLRGNESGICPECGTGMA